MSQDYSSAGLGAAVRWAGRSSLAPMHDGSNTSSTVGQAHPITSAAASGSAARARAAAAAVAVAPIPLACSGAQRSGGEGSPCAAELGVG